MIRGPRRFAPALFMLCFVSPAAVAAKAGLGAQVNANGGYTILLPIRATDALLVEPELSYYKSRDEYSEIDNDVETALDTDDYRSISAGVGLYKQFARREQSRAYAGARVAVFRSTYKNTNDETGDTVEFETNGVTLAPTLGLEYEPYERFSLSLDVALAYQVLFEDSDSSSSTTRTIENDTRRLSTPVRIIARLFF